MNKIVEVKSLVKSYKDVKAVKGIDFYVEEGKLFAFLGPNGAGKSTTIDMICTYLKPDSGEIIVDGCRVGKNDDEIRRRIGIVFQDSVLDPILTVRENITLRGSFYGLKGKKLAEAVENACKIVSITEFMDRPYGKLSGGQRRRADIARALVNTPKILFLDEPTTGLHTHDVKQLISILDRLTKGGNSVIVIEHNLDVIKVADYIIDMGPEGGDMGGTVIAKGTPEEIAKNKNSHTGRFIKKVLEI